MTDSNPKNTKSRNCSVPGCLINKKLNPTIELFSIPTDPQRERNWLENICAKHTAGPIFVCENHFEESLINRTTPLKIGLNCEAVPTLNLPIRLDTNMSTQMISNVITEEQTDKLDEASLLQKRKISLDSSSPQPEKKTKTTSRIEDDGAVLPLQPTKKCCSKLCSNPKFIENVHQDNSQSEPKEQSDKLVELTGGDPIINEETLQETNDPVTGIGAFVIKKMKEAQSQTHMPVTPGTTIEDTETSEGVIKGASNFTLKLHELQIRMKSLSHSSIGYKQLSLRLYLKFPYEYKIMQNELNLLPKLQLKCVIQDSIISIDKCDLFKACLNQKSANMTPKQKQCFLCICESKIKSRYYYDISKDKLLGIHDVDGVLKPEPATTAIVLIAQGIFEDWKQPVGVSYLANDSPSIKPWIGKVIKRMMQSGLTVRAILFENDSTHFIKNPYYINKKKIYCFHDFSNLLNSFYYNFIKFGYYSDTTNIVYQGKDIVDYYEIDSKKTIPLTPKITRKLINPTTFQELNIKSVMEVFSMATAAAVSAYIDFKLLDEFAQSSVELITKISKLYDILNIGSSLNDENRGFTGETSQINFLEDTFVLFDHLQLNNPDSIPLSDHSHKNVNEKLKILITSVLALSENLKAEKYEYLPIWRFSMHAAKSFFDQVQRHSKSITKPTARDVNSIYRQTAIIHLLKIKNRTKMYNPVHMEEVVLEFLGLSKFFRSVRHNADIKNPMFASATAYKISSSEYNTLKMGENGIIFLAGFLLNKCTSLHNNCIILKMYNSRTASDVETLSMCESIMEDVRKNICVLPSSEFIELVESMEISFRAFMNKEIICAFSDQIIHSLLRVITLELPMPCKCFPVTYVKILYLRFRIYHTLKYNNELNKTKLHTRLIVNNL